MLAQTFLKLFQLEIADVELLALFPLCDRVGWQLFEVRVSHQVQQKEDEALVDTVLSDSAGCRISDHLYGDQSSELVGKAGEVCLL